MNIDHWWVYQQDMVECKGGGRRFVMGGKTTGCLGDESPPAVGDESPPAGSRGRAPVGGQGASSPEAEEFTSKLYAFFGSISHIFTYICFFRACRHHSTKSAKWGAFDTVCPLVCKWGATDPSAPSSAAYGGCGRERLLWTPCSSFAAALVSLRSLIVRVWCT